MNRGDLEYRVVGGVLIDPDKFYSLPVTPDDFDQPVFKKAWELISQMLEEGEIVDVISLSSKIVENSKWEETQVLPLLVDCSQSANDAITDTAAKKLREVSYRGQLYVKLKDIARKLSGRTPIAEIIHELMDLPLIEDGSTHDLEMLEILTSGFDNLTKVRAMKHGEIYGVDTLFPILNREIGGYYDARLITVSGRPGMGKSIYGLAVAGTAAAQGIPAGFISLELPIEEQALRLVARRSKQTIKSIRELPDERLEVFKNNVMDRMKDWPLYMSNVKKMGDVVSQIVKWRHEKKVEIVVIDYFQYIEGGDSSSRQQELSTIARALEHTKNKLGIPIMAIAQMNRGIETSNREPEMSDIRESGQLENCSDMVMFFHDVDGQKRAYVKKSRMCGLIDFPILFQGEIFNMGDMYETP